MLPWMVMEVTRVVTLVVHLEDLLRSTRLLLLDHPARVVLPLLIKVYNKAVTRTQVPTKTIPRISISALKETPYHNRESSINLTHRGHIIHLTYRTSTGVIQEGICRRTMPVDRIYTIDIVVVNKLEAIRQARRPTLEVTATRLHRRHIRLLYPNKRLPVNLLHLPSLPLLRLIRAHKIIIDRNREDMELQQGHKYIQGARVQTRTCLRHRQVQTRLGAILILPKTNSILNIINQDQRIQDGQIQPTSTTAVVGAVGYHTHRNNRNHNHNRHSHHRSNQRHRSVLYPLRLQQEQSLVISNGVISNQIELLLNRL